VDAGFLIVAFSDLTHRLCSVMFSWVTEGNHDNEKIYGDPHFSLRRSSRLTKAGNTAGKLLINQLNADNKVREKLVEKFDLYKAKLGPYCVNRFSFKPTEIDEECRTGIIQHIFN